MRVMLLSQDWYEKLLLFGAERLDSRSFQVKFTAGFCRINTQQILNTPSTTSEHIFRALSYEECCEWLAAVNSALLAHKQIVAE